MIVLFFDTETSGLPKNFKASYQDTENWPRLVQIAWSAYKIEGFYQRKLGQALYTIKPEGFIIKPEAEQTHGISTERALKEGLDALPILTKFQEAVHKSHIIVGHNVVFDVNIVASEWYRRGLTNAFESKEIRCTMKESTKFCGLYSRYGNKWPKLSELHSILFNEEFADAHNALGDVLATERCFFELLRRNHIRSIY